MEIKLEINNISKLDEVIKVGYEIFKPSKEELKTYWDKNLWLERFANGGLLITASINNKIIGISLSYKKDNALHLGNAGVLEEYRSHGVYRQMHELRLKEAKKMGYTKLTVNTYKDKFPIMYAFLKKEGFVEFKTENGKSFFEKQI